MRQSTWKGKNQTKICYVIRIGGCLTSDHKTNVHAVGCCDTTLCFTRLAREKSQEKTLYMSKLMKDIDLQTWRS